MNAPSLDDLRAARERIAGIARLTPVYESETFSRRTGREVLLKAENLQRTGAFKIRGAVNKISTLTDAERAAGVVAASAGNHGQAVAWAARAAGSRATIFMPEDSPMAKVDATRSYGAEVELTGAGFDDSLAAAQELVARAGGSFVHAFEDELVIAGQGTIGLELVEQVPNATTFVLPIGGGHHNRKYQRRHHTHAKRPFQSRCQARNFLRLPTRHGANAHQENRRRHEREKHRVEVGRADGNFAKI